MGNSGETIFSNQFMPHGFCFLWRPELVWLHALADLITALAYFAIPLTIFIILQKNKRHIPFRWVFGMLATFIFFGGLTSVLELISIWQPIYYLEGLVKVFTAAISFATALMMFPLIPVIISRFEELNKNSGHTGADDKNRK